MRYRCLVLDHDDTVVESTEALHYPAFLDAMEKMRPDFAGMTLQEYFLMNFRPGFLEYCQKELKLTEAEMQRELGIWQSWVDRIVPRAYPGMAKIIRRHVSQGGILCVVSHSVDVNIRRDYRENGLPEPVLVYGWERPPEERKPAAYPLLQIMEKLKLTPEELIMVDDMKQGFDMAKKCDVAFGAAGWAYDVKEIKDFMRENSDWYFDTPEELERFLFEEE